MRAGPSSASPGNTGPLTGGAAAGSRAPLEGQQEEALPAWASGARFSTYEIDSLLASGGMAEIWRAKIVGMQGFEKRIVIKTMHPHYRHRQDLVEMFVREASLAARLSHPNIVDVIDFGQLEGRYFIAMEYVPGMSLRFALKQKRKRGERLPVAAVLHVARDICEALQYMHDLEDGDGVLGLCHRDLSPENIMLSTSGTTKVIDFGTARATARTPPSPGFVGKYRYAAPERIRREGEDHRSDIYSLGVILFECLVGRRAFEGTDTEIVHAVTSNLCCDPSARVVGLLPQVADVVKKATAANPSDRFASAQAMGTALARCLVALRATNKEREVTAALASLMDEAPSAGASGPSSTGPAETPSLEAVPELIGRREDISGRQPVLAELEMLEASGPLRMAASAPAKQERVEAAAAEPADLAHDAATDVVLDPIVESFDQGEAATPAPLPAPHTQDRGVAAPVNPGRTRRARARTLEIATAERAVALFDQGLKLRLEGRYEDALAAWEAAVHLAPGNQLYQAQVDKLSAQLATAGPAGRKRL